MEYRPLGTTGLEVSALGLGASALGSMFRPVSDDEAAEVVHAAYDSGITYFDVSPYYGGTVAESRLGSALTAVPRRSVVISTKAGRYGENLFDFSRTRVTQSIEESLQRLRTDYLDIVFLHDIEFGHPSQVLEEGWRALVDARTAGKIRCAGASGLPLDVLTRFAAAAQPDVILSYCHYCLNDTTLLDAVPRLMAGRVGLVNASPLAMGLLTQNGPPEWHPAPAQLKEQAAAAARWAECHGVDLADLALQFATRRPEIPTTLVSTANAAHLARNVRVLAEAVDETALAGVLEVLAPVMNLTWASGPPT
ncbi:MAG: aldo/keto reductase [Thermaerobacter sp.]|nr:aldo/keto reductase [Thermaerobacter sp.]